MTPSSPPVRLVLVDDHEMVIEGLKAMLAAFSDRVEVVGQAVGAERAHSVVDELDPDIVLCDVRMQGASGLDLCLQLRESDPKRKVVMLSVYDDEQYLFQALRVGASGYLLKSISSDELVRQLELVHGGEIPHKPRIPAMRQQCLLLLRSRQQPKPRHTRTVTTNTDNPGSGTPAPLTAGFLPRLTSRVPNRRRLR